MAGIIYKHNNSLISLTGNAYTAPVAGTARLCVKTGTNTVKFGLTTNTSATQYCGIRMKVKDQVAYIGRTESTKSTIKSTSSTTVSTSKSSSTSTSSSTSYQTNSTRSYTTSRTSQYDTNSQTKTTKTLTSNWNENVASNTTTKMQQLDSLER